MVVVSHHRVGLEQALGNGILGGMVDGGGEEVPVLIHLKTRRAEGDLEGDFALVLHTGLRVGDGLQGPVDVGEGGDWGGGTM